jgi:hypothetical protein
LAKNLFPTLTYDDTPQVGTSAKQTAPGESKKKAVFNGDMKAVAKQFNPPYVVLSQPGMTMLKDETVEVKLKSRRQALPVTRPVQREDLYGVVKQDKGWMGAGWGHLEQNRESTVL